jgi:ethanolamine utilization microcompartment shell protein EutL
LEFSVNPSTVNPDGWSTFYALVTDPQGIADLIGGSLKSSDGTTIAAFASSADEGSYSNIRCLRHAQRRIRTRHDGELGDDDSHRKFL